MTKEQFNAAREIDNDKYELNRAIQRCAHQILPGDDLFERVGRIIGEEQKKEILNDIARRCQLKINELDKAFQSL